MSIRILIADHHEIARMGLRRLLEGSDIEIVAEADNGRDAVSLASRHKIDVVVIESQMPLEDGLTAMGRIRNKSPEMGILFFSAHESPTYIARAVAMGANGYLLKSEPQQQIIEAIRTVADGQNTWTKKLLRQVSSALRVTRPKADKEGLLTQREYEVLAKLTEGLTNRQIAEQLNISSETIKEHVQHILRKLGVSDRTQAAVWAVRNGLA
jgi:DNA-binding NarL/FixJ family response regulator